MYDEITINGVDYVKKKAVVDSWEALNTVTGYYVNGSSGVEDANNAETCAHNRNIWATEEQAEACLAMSQLSQLLKDVNGNWKPDWCSDSQKGVICWGVDEVYASVKGRYRKPGFLTFKTFEVALEFLKLHRDLIGQARPLL